MRVAALLPPSFHKEDNMNTENIIDIAINFNDPEWILKHITIALQRTSDADFVKRPCDLEGIEQYLIVRGEQDDACYSAKVTSALLSNAGIACPLSFPAPQRVQVSTAQPSSVQVGSRVIISW